MSIQRRINNPFNEDFKDWGKDANTTSAETYAVFFRAHLVDSMCKAPPVGVRVIFDDQPYFAKLGNAICSAVNKRSEDRYSVVQYGWGIAEGLKATGIDILPYEVLSGTFRGERREELLYMEFTKILNILTITYEGPSQSFRIHAGGYEDSSILFNEFSTRLRGSTGLSAFQCFIEAALFLKYFQPLDSSDLLNFVSVHSRFKEQIKWRESRETIAL